MKVAVIGAGASGIAAVKSCLEEGLEPTCYEKSDHIGGLWHYSPEVVVGEPSVMNCTVSNVSKEMMCFSDFPAPIHYPPYMRHRQVDSYLGLYADEFGLRRHIKTRHEVLGVSETADHNTSGRWIVKVKHRTTEITEETTFDFVMVCAGVLGQPYIPDIPGISTFEGHVIHSHGYRAHTGFENKAVLVVGLGNSAGDVACDVTNVAKQVYISSRNGGWVMSRVDDYGLPLDIITLSRASTWAIKHFPNLIDLYIQNKLNKRLNHILYGFCPQISVTQSQPFINDDIPVRVISGAIKVKPEVKCLTRNSAQFVDGSCHEIDAVVFGTGYRVDFPFLSDAVTGADITGFYKGIFPVKRNKNTLAIIGCFRAKGPLFPILEMQSRVVVGVFNGQVKLPSCTAMSEAVARWKERERRKRKIVVDFILEVDFIPYLDGLSAMIGCKPNLGRMLFTDPRLAKKIIFGPCCPYQYRLSGPHSWAGAREAIFTLMGRICSPLNPNLSKRVRRKKSKQAFKLTIVITAVSFAMYFMIQRSRP